MEEVSKNIEEHLIKMTSHEFNKVVNSAKVGDVGQGWYCEFIGHEKHFHFKKIQIDENIYISKNLTFHKTNYDRTKFNITIEQSVIANIWIENELLNITVINHTHVGHIFIKGTRIGIKICNNSTTGDIHLSLESEVSQLEITDRSQIENLSTYNSFINQFYVDNQSRTGIISLNDKARVNFIRVESSTIGNIFTNNSDLSHCFVRKESKTGSFYLLNKSHIGELRIETESNIGDFSLRSESSLESFVISSSGIGKFSAEDSVITRYLFFKSSDVRVLDLGNTEISRDIRVEAGYIGVLTCSSFKPIRAFLNNTRIGIIRLNAQVLSKDSVLQFNDVLMNRLEIISFLNWGIVSFKNINPINNSRVYNKEDNLYLRTNDGKYLYTETHLESVLTIQNSDLGKISFIGCNLNLFNRFEFYNTKMLEAFIAGAELPNNILVPEEYSQTSIEQQKLAFSQFKKMYENIGDSVKALEYKAKEMEVYKRQLLSGEKWHNISEKINLQFMHYSSFYGTKWQWALRWLIGIWIIGYAGYCAMLGNLPGHDINRFWHIIVHNPSCRYNLLFHSQLILQVAFIESLNPDSVAGE